jgi:tRNA threonylcarbamoyl adenosine modification protein YeaZ
MAPPPVRTLAIETSNPSAGGAGRASAGVALGRVADGSAEVDATEWLGVEDRHSDDLMPAIDRLCANAGVRPGQIGLVAVSVGPGAYTALRIAVATAKVLAEITGARCVAVPTALALARRGPAGRGVVCLASKHGSTHATEIDAASPLGEGRVIHADALPELAARGGRWLMGDAFLPGPIRDEAARLGLAVVEPAFDPAEVLRAAAGLPAIPADALAERYAREPDAVTQWRARHG